MPLSLWFSLPHTFIEPASLLLPHLLLHSALVSHPTTARRWEVMRATTFELTRPYYQKLHLRSFRTIWSKCIDRDEHKKPSLSPLSFPHPPSSPPQFYLSPSSPAHPFSIPTNPFSDHVSTTQTQSKSIISSTSANIWWSHVADMEYGWSLQKDYSEKNGIFFLCIFFLGLG